MSWKNYLFCPWPNVKFVTEDISLKRGLSIALTSEILSPTRGLHQASILIFIKKSNEEYEVLVIKSSPNDRYKKLPQDNFIRYVEDEDCISFFFNSFYDTIKFTDAILPFHQEFQDRPILPIR